MKCAAKVRVFTLPLAWYCIAALIARSFRVFAGLLNSLMVEVILGLLAQEKHIFMALGAAISHRLRHWIWFRPDNVLAQIPAISLKSEGHSPWNAYEVLGLKAMIKFRKRQTAACI